MVAMIDAYGNTGDPRWAGCAEVVASAGLWWPFETVAVLTERLVRATQG